MKNTACRVLFYRFFFVCRPQAKQSQAIFYIFSNSVVWDGDGISLSWIGHMGVVWIKNELALDSVNEQLKKTS